MKVFKIAVFGLFFITFCITNLFCAEISDGKYILGDQITIRSEILDQDRQILVYLPTGYEISTAKYPVMYLLDGGYHFHHATGIVQYLSGLGMMPQTIVVAIQNIDRNKDFLPTNVEFVPTSGGAEDFLSFISNELIPYVDEHFRTVPYRTLMGHSFGGTFTAYTFLEKPDLFNAYIAISPVMHWDNDLLVTNAETLLKSEYGLYKFYFMTLGDEPDYIPAIEKFNKLIETKSPKNLDFSYTYMPEENHGTIPHRTIYNALEKLYNGWALPRDVNEQGLAAVDAHYKKITEKFGYDNPTPELVINMLGYNHLGKKEFEKAIEVFQENVKRFPVSANVYDSLGDAYENNEQFELAKKNYAKAFELAKDDDPAKNIFQQNLKRMQEKLGD
ncbi:alpha/beta hydrolase-fold protein [Candidatus Cloacimonadota bacterium]